MSEKITAIHLEEAHGLRCEHNKASLNRIRRVKGQLEALERMIEADEGSCEDRVIRARTIEKGINSLTRHMVECYLVNTARYEMQEDPDQAVRDIMRIFELMGK